MHSMKSGPGISRTEPSVLERLGVAAAAALFLSLVTFRQGTFIYLFHRASTGAWIDEGARVLDGEVMYRDFVDAIAPGIVYLNAGVLALLGHRLEAMALAGLLVGCALACALHALASRVASWPWRLLPSALFVVLAYPGHDFGGHRWPALLLGLLGLLALSPRPIQVSGLGGGLLFGLSSLFTPEIGLSLWAGTCAGLLRAPRIQGVGLAGLLLGLMAAVALVGGWFATQGAGDVVMDAWLRGIWADRLDGPGVHMFGSWGARSAACLVAAAAGATAGTVSLRRRETATGPPIATPCDLPVQAAAGFGLLLSAGLGTVDAHALAVHSTLLTVCLAAELPAWRGTAARWTRRGVLAILVLGLVHGSVGLIVWRQWLQPLTRQRFRAGEAWIGAPNLELRWLETQTQPGERVFVLPAGGAAYFLTATRNATSFPYVVEGQLNVPRQREALSEIEAAKPAVGVWLSEQRFAPPRGAEDLTVLYEGIRSSYDPAAVLPGGTLLLRRKPRLDRSDLD